MPFIVVVLWFLLPEEAIRLWIARAIQKLEHTGHGLVQSQEPFKCCHLKKDCHHKIFV